MIWNALPISAVACRKNFDFEISTPTSPQPQSAQIGDLNATALLPGPTHRPSLTFPSSGGVGVIGGQSLKMSTSIPEVGVVASTSSWYRKASDVDLDARVKVQVARTSGQFLRNFRNFRFPCPPACVAVLRTLCVIRAHYCGKFYCLQCFEEEIHF